MPNSDISPTHEATLEGESSAADIEFSSNQKSKILAFRLLVTATLLVVPLFSLMWIYISYQQEIWQSHVREETAFNVLQNIFEINRSITHYTKDKTTVSPLPINSSIDEHKDRVLHLVLNDTQLYNDTLDIRDDLNRTSLNLSDYRDTQHRFSTISNLTNQFSKIAVNSAGVATVIRVDSNSTAMVNLISLIDLEHTFNHIHLLLNELEAGTNAIQAIDDKHRFTHSLISNFAKSVDNYNPKKSTYIKQLFAEYDTRIRNLIKSYGRLKFIGITNISSIEDKRQKTLLALQALQEGINKENNKLFTLLIENSKSQIEQSKSNLYSILGLVILVIIVSIFLGYYIFRSIRFTQSLMVIQNRDLEAGIAQRTSELTEAKNKMENLVSELRKESERAEQANKAKSLFLASMSHEIRTPLNAIIGGSSLLKKTPLNIKQQQTLNLISTSSHSLLDLVNDILDFSKIEAGEMSLERIDFDLESIALEAVDMFSLRAQEKCLDMLLDFDAQCEGIWQGDPTRLRQILINLIGNALKFTERGNVTLTVSHDNSDTNNIIISISDTGIGMSAEAQKKLFQSFSQIDNSITRKYGGTGLGLSISLKLAQLMDGDISVESQQGVGSTFILTLPLVQASSIEYTTLKNEHILLIHTTDITAKRLQQWGASVYEMSTATALSSGKGFVDRISTIVIEKQLPEMNFIALQQCYKHARIFIVGECNIKKYDNTLQIFQWPKAEQTRQLLLSELSTEQLEPLALSHEDHNIQFSGLILLVEDVVFNQVIASDFLEDLGLDVEVVNNGREAVAEFRNHPYQMIFMDLHMPEMNGYDAAKTIRQIEQEHELPTTPIIALTADVIQDTKAEVYRSGMNDYLTKPFSEDKLVTILSHYLTPQLNMPSESSLASSSDNSSLPLSETKAAQKPSRALQKTSSATAIDSQVFDYISLENRVRNKVERAISLLERFVAEYDEYLEEISDAASENNRTQLAESAHKLKGISGNLGLMKVSQCVGIIEQHARSGTQYDFDNEIVLLVNHLGAAKHQIKLYLTQVESSR